MVFQTTALCSHWGKVVLTGWWKNGETTRHFTFPRGSDEWNAIAPLLESRGMILTHPDAKTGTDDE
jgi:hypothetical protein